MAILKLNQLLQQTGGKRSQHYRKTSEGLFTTPVKLNGARASGWPDHEVKAIVAARTAGADDAEIRSLVEKLHASRAAIYEGTLRQISELTPQTLNATSPFNLRSLGVEDQLVGINNGGRSKEIDDASVSQTAKTVRRSV